MRKGLHVSDDSQTNRPILVRLTNQRDNLNEEQLGKHFPNSSLDQGDVVFTTTQEPADVVVVLNYLKYDCRIQARSGYVWNWHNEPIVRKPFAKGYAKIFSHDDSTEDPRVEHAPPILDWWVNRTYDELKAMPPPQKTKAVSAIASTKTLIDGHRNRNRFLNKIEKEVPEVEVFGRGRARPLSDKWDGLAPYRFSIAIENSASSHYWTEKIADCFLAFTVPIYFGAPNIDTFFPAESVVSLPLDDPDMAIDLVRDALTDRKWENRFDALVESRRLVLDEYSTFGQLVTRIRSLRGQILSEPTVAVRVHGRRTRPGGWIRGVGLRGNLVNQRARLRARLG